MSADVRQLAINPSHWYPVVRGRDLKDKPVSVQIWGESVVLWRGETGVHALEDRCPHRLVKLSHGHRRADRIECAYHGWLFDSDGKCTHVPYLEPTQKPPRCQVRTYAVREQYGFVWLFAGNAAEADGHVLLAIPEWDHLNYIATVSVIDCKAHYSYLIENLMDMHHAPLHSNYQAWSDAVLEKLHEEPERVDAHYRAQSHYRIDRIWSIAQLFVPALRKPHPESLTVSYVYPHWTSSLGTDFKIYCLLCPIGPLSTRAWLVHFTSLGAFRDLHRLPKPVRLLVKQSLFGSARGLLDGLVRQDILMIEQEQQAYLAHPEHSPWEINRALAAVQRLMRFQVVA